jgi:hypothetical protein
MAKPCALIYLPDGEPMPPINLPDTMRRVRRNSRCWIAGEVERDVGGCPVAAICAPGRNDIADGYRLAGIAVVDTEHAPHDAAAPDDDPHDAAAPEPAAAAPEPAAARRRR